MESFKTAIITMLLTFTIVMITVTIRANKEINNLNQEVNLYENSLDVLENQTRALANECGYAMCRYEDRTDKNNPRIWFELTPKTAINFDTLGVK